MYKKNSNNKLIFLLKYNTYNNVKFLTYFTVKKRHYCDIFFRQGVFIIVKAT